MPRSITEGRYRARATPQHFGLLPTEIPISEDRRNVVPDIAGLAWYACTCVPQAERRAAQSLRRERERLAGRRLAPLHAYVPCSTEWVRRKRGATDLPRREVQTPLARSYVFVGVDGGLRAGHLGVMSERDHEGRNRHGLIAVLGNGEGRPQPLDGADLWFLVRLAAEEVRAGQHRVIEGGYEAGDRVHVEAGPFATHDVEVTAVDPDRGRLLADFMIFGRAVPIELDFADVRKAA